MANDAQPETSVVKMGRPMVCYCIAICLIGYLGIAVAIIIIIHINFFSFLPNLKLLRAHIMCGGFGMLGALMAAIRKFYRILITDSTRQANGKRVQKLTWDFGWTFYYLTRPILGSVLGALSYTLSFIGFNALASSTEITISREGHFLLYALALVSGFSVSQVLDKLNTTAKNIFQNKGKIDGT